HQRPGTKRSPGVNNDRLIACHINASTPSQILYLQVYYIGNFLHKTIGGHPYKWQCVRAIFKTSVAVKEGKRALGFIQKGEPREFGCIPGVPIDTNLIGNVYCACSSFVPTAHLPD